MSPTMFLGRVVLPAIGLLVAAGVTWHSFRRSRPAPRLSAWGARRVCSSRDRPDHC